MVIMMVIIMMVIIIASNDFLTLLCLGKIANRQLVKIRVFFSTTVFIAGQRLLDFRCCCCWSDLSTGDAFPW